MYESVIFRIKEELTKASDLQEIKKLNDEFIELWKKEPNGVSEQASEAIDEIRSLLWNKLEK